MKGCLRSWISTLCPRSELGKVVISTNSGNKTISNVLFVPDLDQNLLSVGKLLEKGHSFIF